MEQGQRVESLIGEYWESALVLPPQAMKVALGQGERAKRSDLGHRAGLRVAAYRLFQYLRKVVAVSQAEP
jgi:hypothetical protein